MSDQTVGILQSKRWYNGYGENQDLMNDGQFQYGVNVDIFNDISGIQLSSKKEIDNTSPTASVNSYCSYNSSKLFRFMSDKTFTFADNLTWLTRTACGSTTYNIDNAVVFWDDIAGTREARIFAFSIQAVEVIDPNSPYTVTVTNPVDGTYSYSSGGAGFGLVYSGSVLLVAKGNLLRRYVPIGSPELPVGWKVIREFKEGDTIVGLTLSGNYLKIWINERNINTKILYVTGTFDVEDGGVVNTIEWNNMICQGGIKTVDNVDYALMRSSTDNQIAYLYSIDGYKKTMVWKTKYANGQPNQLEYFTLNGGQAAIVPQEKRDIMYLAMGDGVRTYGINKLGQPTINLQWTSGGLPYNKSHIFGDYLYLAGNFPSNFEQRVYLEYRNNGYITSTGIVTDKVEIGEFIREQKENLELVIEYELNNLSANPGSIGIYTRPNRIDKTPTGGFTLVSTITDNTKLVHRVSVSQLLLKQDWDSIEVQYRLIPGTDTLVSPILRDRQLSYANIDKSNGRQ